MNEPKIGTKYRMAMGELIEYKGVIEGKATFHLLESMAGTDISEMKFAIRGEPENLSSFLSGEKVKEVTA